MPIYSADVRTRARELWLAGGRTDTDVAALVGVARADTVRDWRREEDWEALRRSVDAAAAARRATEAAEARAQLSRRHDQLGEALEALVARAMRGGQPPKAAEIRALAGAVALAQRVRRLALGVDEEAPAPSMPTSAAPGTRLIQFARATPPEAPIPAPARVDPAPRRA